MGILLQYNGNIIRSIIMGILLGAIKWVYNQEQ